LIEAKANAKRLLTNHLAHAIHGKSFAGLHIHFAIIIDGKFIPSEQQQQASHMLRVNEFT